MSAAPTSDDAGLVAYALELHAPQWVTVMALAYATELSLDQVRAELQQLAEQGLAEVQHEPACAAAEQLQAPSRIWRARAVPKGGSQALQDACRLSNLIRVEIEVSRGRSEAGRPTPEAQPCC